MSHAPTVTVVICAYTERRWDQIVEAVASLGRQTRPVDQVVLVIDHNPGLLERADRDLDGCDVIPNTGPKGLSGARNSGVEQAKGEVVAFLDDDARAEPGWVDALVAPFRDPDVIGTGGVARADWHDVRPTWFPEEFDWVVGCSYRGLPTTEATIRNPIGANMSFRRDAFEQAGGFQSEFGRMGTLPLGCEETEFSIRLRRYVPDGRIVQVPGAVVDHFVSPDRTTLAYFFRRCIAEGLSKATVTEHVGNQAGLASERRYVTHALPSGFVRGLVPTDGGQGFSPARSGMIVAGLFATTFGYLLGRLQMVGLAGRLLGVRS